MVKRFAWNAYKVQTTELYYISGDRALIQSQSKKCPQKQGGFWLKLRHFDVTLMALTTDQIAIRK